MPRTSCSPAVPVFLRASGSEGRGSTQRPRLQLRPAGKTRPPRFPHRLAPRPSTGHRREKGPVLGKSYSPWTCKGAGVWAEPRAAWGLSQNEPALAPLGTGVGIQTLLLGLLSTSWLRKDEDFWSPQAWHWARLAWTPGPVLLAQLDSLLLPRAGWRLADLQPGALVSGDAPESLRMWTETAPLPRLHPVTGPSGSRLPHRSWVPPQPATWVGTSGSDFTSSYLAFIHKPNLKCGTMFCS